MVGNGSLTDKIVNIGTPCSSTNLQVYTGASSCAWTRQSTLHSRFGTLQLYMNCGLHYIVLLRLFRVDWNPINYSLSTPNRRSKTHSPNVPTRAGTCRHMCRHLQVPTRADTCQHVPTSVILIIWTFLFAN